MPSVINYMDQPLKKPRSFWTTYTGALTEGYAMCYHCDYGTAANRQDERLIHVERPNQDNHMYFAGVLAESYSARAGGQNVKLFTPGSYCYCYLVDTSATLGDMRTFYVGNGATVGAAHGTNAKIGQLSTAGFPGRGSAIVLQTVAAAGLVPCYLMEGPGESGMCEQITVDAGGGAITIMDGGYSYIDGTAASVGNYTFTKGASNRNHQRKGIYQLVAMAANALVVTFTPNGLQLDKTTALASLTFNAINEYACLEYFYDVWQNMHLQGATEA